MKTNLTGKIILISGGSSGLGYEMSKTLLSHGATVIIASRTLDKLSNVYKEFSQQNYNIHTVQMDISNEESIEQASKWFGQNFDHLDMLINNAGIGNNAPGMENLPENHHFYDIPISTVQSVINTNFLGFFIVTKKFIPFMQKNKCGSIIYVSTSTKTMTKKGQLPYGPSKAGAEAMANIMAEELRDSGIAVNIICPGGFTDTNMATKEMKDFFIKNNLPILQPNVMNKLILFLASSKSKGITGEKFIGKDFDKWLKEKNIIFEE